MDRNTIIGFVLIFVILIGYSIYNSPSTEEIAQKRKQDSIAYYNQKQKLEDSIKTAVNIKKDTAKTIAASDVNNNDTTVNGTTSNSKQQRYGLFYKSAEGVEKTYTIENDLIKIQLTNKGGKVKSVELKKYKHYDAFNKENPDTSKKLVLFNGDSSNFGIRFFYDNKDIATEDLFFVPYYKGNAIADKIVVTKDSINFSMRLYADTSASPETSNRYVEFQYTILKNNYMIGVKLNFVGLQNIIAQNTSIIDLDWKHNINSVEQSIENERNASTIYFKFNDDEVDYISERSDEEKPLETKLKWISFKNQFFTSVLLADQSFNRAKVKTFTNKSSKTTVKSMTASIEIPYISSDKFSFPMHIYFGPNHYKTLRQYKVDMERQVTIGWGFFLLAWVNRFAVIPVFNFFEGFNLNYGIIILILTILLKIVLLPIAYKTFVSSAKMKILKPEIEEINKKFAKEDAIKKQQATMALYKKAGVSPFAGCIPMLLQFPILISLFYFFPASIELRQQGFLWATDLSTYDSIWTFGNGFSIPFYGDHVSLFTLLMTISTIIYTKVNNDMMGASSQQMPGMKTMMYIMPIMFLGIFNNYSAGLSYYYFLANIITFAQIYLIRLTVDEKKLHKQIEANKIKNANVKKSGFQQKLEEMARKRGYKMPNKK